MLILADPTLQQMFIPNTIFAIFYVILSIPIILSIVYFWHKVRVTQSNNRLKRDMLARGISAQEIEQVMNAGIKQDEK